MSKIDSRLQSFDAKMNASLEICQRDLSGVRAGRASPQLLESIRVDAYGSFVPMNQVGTVAVNDARLVTVNVWDKGLVKSVEKAIRESNIGVDPSIDGQNVRIPIPPLSEQRRTELSKLAAKYGEDAKISIRSIRRDAMEYLKKAEKDKEISEDEQHRLSDAAQELTDRSIQKIDDYVSAKQKDIMSV